MPAQPADLASPPRLPSDAELEIPRGADPESAIIGPLAGRYDVGKRIARGGMGIVYRAHDRLLNRTVAVKIMRGRYMDRPDLLRRFLGEARINGRLQHPGIVPVYEVGTVADARPFIAMKLIEGQTLSRKLRERTNPNENLGLFLKVFEGLCQTMAYAHQEGVIHRDLKPDNVMVGAFGEVQVMDWGLAKFLDPAAAIAPTPDGFEAIEKSAYLSGDGPSHAPNGEHQTQATAIVPMGPDTPGVGYTTAGEVFGTLAYMPPEQARGEMERVDRRGDVFSLGAIICQILTGYAPYYGSPEALREMAREGRLFGAYILLDRSGADQALITLAKNCLSVEPENRPADAGVLADLVTQCLEGLQDRTRQIEVKRLKAEARVAEAEDRARLARQARRLARTLAVVGVIVAAMLATGLGWYANDRIARDADEGRRRATTLEQIDEALTEADSLDGQARTGAGSANSKDTAARQALAACQRADALFATAQLPPNELRERLDATRSRVAETARGTALAVDLEQWRIDLFDSHGTITVANAARNCRETLARHGFDALAPNAAEQLRAHPAANGIRNVLIDWIALTTDMDERSRLIALLRSTGETRFETWLKSLDWESSAPPADALVPSTALAVAAHRQIEAGHFADAEQLLVRGVREFPNDFALIASLGTLLRHRPDGRADALRYLTAARAARPNHPAINLELGLGLADAGRTDDAVEVLRAALKIDPKLARAHARLGDVFWARGDAEGARASYAAAVEADSAYVAGQVGLGQVELAREQFDAADKSFRAALDHGPNAAASAGLARVHLKRWEAAKAITAFRDAVKAEPARVEYRLGLVEALRISNDTTAAIREAQETTRVAPASAIAFRFLGELHDANGDRLAAAAAYRAAVKCDAKDADTQLRLAALCEALDDSAGALQAYLAAADLRPNDLKLRAAVVRAANKSGNGAAASAALKQILLAEPQNKELRRQLGHLLADQGDDAAIAELRKVVDADPKSPNPRSELAEVLLRFGKFREAARAYRDAADHYPDASDKREDAISSARNTLRWAGLEKWLPQILDGTAPATTPATFADYGEVCARTGHYAHAARYFRQAANEDEQFARSSAVYSALAGFGRGDDAKTVSNEKRVELRRTALAALQHSRNWTVDPALKAIKNSSTIEELPAPERDSWRSLWAGSNPDR